MTSSTLPPLPPLPIVQASGHGGLGVPEEVADRLAIGGMSLYNEADLWMDEVADFSHPDLADLHRETGFAGVLGRATMPIARGLIDTNRFPDDFDNPDGPVKSQTSYGETIYTTPLSRHEQIALRDRYWAAFHREMGGLMNQHVGETRLFLDCHSMAQVGPTTYAFAGATRPKICLCTDGDGQGKPRTPNVPTSCPPGFAFEAARLAEKHFDDLPMLEPERDPTGAPIEVPTVALNWPFFGGYILRTYAGPSFRPTPESVPYGLMVEVNRGLYVGNQDNTTPIRPPNQAAIAEVRRRLFRWVADVVKLI